MDSIISHVKYHMCIYIATPFAQLSLNKAGETKRNKTPMQMQPKNARSRPKCTQALLKCAKEAWYKPRSKEEGEWQIADDHNQNSFPWSPERNNENNPSRHVLRWSLTAGPPLHVIQSGRNPINNSLQQLLLEDELTGPIRYRDPSSSLPSRRIFDAFYSERAGVPS